MGVAILAALPTALAGRWLMDATALIQLAVMGAVFALLYLGIGQLSGAARPREWLQAIADLARQR